MAGLLSNFRNTIILSVILALAMIFAYFQLAGGPSILFWQAVLRWIHTFFGILWIGLLYYFNFVQIRKMPEIPAELKPAVSKYIAPEALFWFRWAALGTWVVGVILAMISGKLISGFTLGASEGFVNQGNILLGIGMWLATIMFINVWAFIWPNQKIALGIVEADADAKAKAAKTAMLFSRTNLLLSIPMLTAMTMTQTLG
ncbi:urate hydroxylase PuuD [Caulobacter mirabilis]|uniref:Urate oxidase N-terminal domain-containing protein n=1 Tax=Caulobacter mirabilis TaxID=69666 RepID=A0A2D2AWV4_9CAUL|nr:urate hydroxylase PuuD [Caulobacter mirabilis]ATQ42476.1 hypothetical protein CSW64_08635 [Caulobacter mirabilis]